jgi:predicted alpha/beta hydrolase family esterase
MQTIASKPATTRAAPVLVLPGWKGSGPGHWQSRWEHLHGHTRVDQHDWDRPLRGDWTARLEEVLLDLPGPPAVLVAHSLGCLLVAAWASHSRNTSRVAGALLVAPPDVSTPTLQPVLASWASLALQRLPFPSVVVASQDDPYGSLAHAGELAQAWGAHWVDVGCAGHLNADSGLGDWPEGHACLLKLLALTDRRLAGSHSI